MTPTSKSSHIPGKSESTKRQSGRDDVRDRSRESVFFAAAVKDGRIVHSVPDQDDWAPHADTAYNELQSVLSEQQRLKLKDGRSSLYLVVAITTLGGSTEIDIGDALAFRSYLRSLFVAGQASERVAASGVVHLSGNIVSGIWPPTSAQTAGRLLIRLLLVNGKTQAADVCDEMASGDINKVSSARDTTPSVDRVAQIKDLLDRPNANEYETLREHLGELFDLVRTELAARLELALNDQASRVRHVSYDDKKTLAKWINAELRRFGLAIRCPRTGNRCYLMGNPGGQVGVGRFMLEYTDESGKRHHPLTSVDLPHINLMLDALDQNTLGKDRSRIR